MTCDEFSRFLLALGAEARRRGVAFFDYELIPPEKQYLWDDCSQWEDVFEDLAWAAGGHALAAEWRAATSELRRYPSDRDGAGRSRSLVEQLAERRLKSERLAEVGAAWMPRISAAAHKHTWEEKEARYWQIRHRMPTYASLRP